MVSLTPKPVVKLSEKLRDKQERLAKKAGRRTYRREVLRDGRVRGPLKKK